jgi:hypothetical protein
LAYLQIARPAIIASSNALCLFTPRFVRRPQRV